MLYCTQIENGPAMGDGLGWGVHGDGRVWFMCPDAYRLWARLSVQMRGRENPPCVGQVLVHEVCQRARARAHTHTHTVTHIHTHTHTHTRICSFSLCCRGGAGIHGTGSRAVAAWQALQPREREREGEGERERERVARERERERGQLWRHDKPSSPPRAAAGAPAEAGAGRWPAAPRRGPHLNPVERIA